MDASMASYQARLATFEGAATTKSRRSSSRSKKAPKAKAAWPLAAPSAQDLAYSGFVWRPTPASPDNVQCWACNCQLDGWEEEDVPAYEHLTHSPSCGFAVVTAIRLRHGDPGRTEEDPTSDVMITARQETFGPLWPLDPDAGYPSIQQLAAAGWFYDPAGDTPDGVSCPYCHLSLDAWDAGDDPLEEHRRRAPDCLFFALNELYHPTKPVAKAKRGPKSKRVSNSSSTISSTASTAPAKRGPKTKRVSDSSTISSTASIIAPEKKTRASTVSNATSTTGAKKKTRTSTVSNATSTVAPKKRTTRASTVSNATSTVAPKKKTTRASTVSIATSATAPTKKVRGQKHASEPMEDVITHFPEELLDAKKTRGKKRTSEAMEDATHISESPEDSTKRMRYSSISSLPDDLPVGTPKKMPTELETEPFTMSSLPGSLLVGTPKRTPTHLRVDEEDENTVAWEPIDMDAFFSGQQDARGFMNEIMIDAGLDELSVTGTTTADIQAAVVAGLTDAEKEMTVEQWVLYNAKRGEEKLRMACEQQILAFQAEGRRALAMLEAIPTY
jgi:hypothetical protein